MGAETAERRRRRDVVLIGASAGGVEALMTLLAALPVDLEAAIALTLHRSPSVPSMLEQVLARASRLPVIEPTDGQAFERGSVYVAPPDRHLVLHGGAVSLQRGPKQHHTRPAIDPMFTSGANLYGERVIGVLLTGELSDGVLGLIDIKGRGGLSLVQDPAEAPSPSMPRNALVHDSVDAIFSIRSVGPLLERLCQGESVAAATRLPGARQTRPSDRLRARANAGLVG
jgi:two-component system chemotaxis response regulator CheB